MIQSFLLPTPPSTNNLFINVKGRGRIKSRQYKAWAEEAGWRLLAQRVRPVSGRVHVTIRAIRKDGRRRDIDNIIKPILDLLVAQRVISDDRHVEMVSASWVVSADLAGVSVTLKPMETSDVP